VSNTGQAAGTNTCARPKVTTLQPGGVYARATALGAAVAPTAGTPGDPAASMNNATLRQAARSTVRAGLSFMASRSASAPSMSRRFVSSARIGHVYWPFRRAANEALATRARTSPSGQGGSRPRGRWLL
jgi:hypothetical protein